MKITSLTAIALAGLFFVTFNNKTLAVQFDPMFCLVNLRGDCSVKAPDGNQFVEATEGKAYPYGSKVVAGTNSSALIVLSEGNVCRIMDNTMVSVDQDRKNKNKRMIFLDTGKLEVEIDDDISKSGNCLQIVTVTSISEPAGLKPKFLVESSDEEDLKVSLVTCKDGTLNVFGVGFDAAMSKGDVLSATGSRDKRFVRLKNVKGGFDLAVKNTEGKKEIRKTKPGSVAKIWRKKSEAANVLVIRLLLISPEGTLEDAITYSEKVPSWDVIEAVNISPEPIVAQSPIREKNADKPSKVKKDVKLPSWLDEI